MSRALVFRLVAILLGLAGALAISEVAIRLFFRDRLANVMAIPEEQFERPGVEGVAWLYRKNLAGLTNADGFLNVAPTPREKRAGSVRLLVVGDSVTASLTDGRASAARLYPHLVERRLREATARDVDVLNLSAPGLSLRQELALVRARGLPWGPDAIVFAFCHNDPVETDVGRHPNFVVGFPALLSLSAWSRYAQEQADERGWYERGGPVHARLEETFAELGALAGGRRVAVLGLPRLTGDRRRQEHLWAVRSLARKNGVAYVDVLDAMLARALPNLGAAERGDLVHFSARGHEALADVLAERLAPFVKDGTWPPAGAQGAGAE